MGNIYVLEPIEYSNYYNNIAYVVEYRQAPSIFDRIENQDMRVELMTPSVLSWMLRNSCTCYIYSANRVIVKDYIKENPNIKINVWKGAM